LTSNKSYGEWGEIFADQVLANVIPDRLLHHSTIFTDPANQDLAVVKPLRKPISRLDLSPVPF
jgi:DNA replication protein DnaC